MTLIWSGLALGAIYALVAVGYNIVFVSSGAFNFANAQLIMLGTFVAYWGLDVLKLNVGLVFLLSAAIVAAVAGLEERIAIRSVRGVEAQLVTTVGVATLLNGVTSVIWGGEPLEVPFFGSSTVKEVLGGRVFPVELWLIGVAIVLSGVLWLFSRKTLLGTALLAVSEDREAASLRGINVR
ncbi:MAG TPA: branched-chain amino acid ABC transporter permease, partial [Acidimicrobiales bacterium]|nr:branched-chain amino acid ABC transporter permease [Acidimicrobiales bacterium]